MSCRVFIGLTYQGSSLSPFLNLTSTACVDLICHLRFSLQSSKFSSSAQFFPIFMMFILTSPGLSYAFSTIVMSLMLQNLLCVFIDAFVILLLVCPTKSLSNCRTCYQALYTGHPQGRQEQGRLKHHLQFALPRDIEEKGKKKKLNSKRDPALNFQNFIEFPKTLQSLQLGKTGTHPPTHKPTHPTHPPIHPQSKAKARHQGNFCNFKILTRLAGEEGFLERSTKGFLERSTKGRIISC